MALLINVLLFKKCASNYKMNARAMQATVHRCIKSYLKVFPTL